MSTILSKIVFSVTMGARLTDTVQGVTPMVTATTSKSVTIGTGTSANQADQYFEDINRAITSASNETLDMFDLTNFELQTDPLKNVITNTEIVSIVIINNGPGQLVVGGDGTAAAWVSMFGSNIDTVNVESGGVFALAAPGDPAFAVVDTTNHLLKMAAVGGDVTYDIAFLSRSA